VALLLSTLGVGDETILDDYELSAVVYSDEQIAKLRTKLDGTGIDVDRYQAIFGAPRKAMAAFLENLRGRYGSAEGYLSEEAGVDVDVVVELRHHLVEAIDADRPGPARRGGSG
jgi:protein-tyrosine phosphatase